jgi:hypothetical protein
MAAGMPDRVDCLHLADDAAPLRRVYELSELPRLQDLLADVQGAVHASKGRVSLRELVEEELRPMAALQNLLKKT